MTGMENLPTTRDLTLRGEVVETFERDGIRIVKVSFPLLQIELPSEILDAAHLGDKVNISARLVLHSVDSDFGSINHA